MASDDFKLLEKDILSTLQQKEIAVEGIRINPRSGGYIDHQSICPIKDILPDSCKTFSDFIFNPAYNLEIRSDCDDWGDSLIIGKDKEDHYKVKDIYQ